MTDKKFKFDRKDPVEDGLDFIAIHTDEHSQALRLSNRLEKMVRNKQVYVVLDDGKTYAPLAGCKVVFAGDPSIPALEGTELEEELERNYREEIDTLDVDDLLNFWAWN